MRQATSNQLPVPCDCQVGLLPVPGFRWLKWGAIAGGAVLLLYWLRKAAPAAVQEAKTMTAGALDNVIAQLTSWLQANGVEPAAAKAVMSIESGGRYGPVAGRPLIRFEPHVFKRDAALSAAQVPLLPGMASPTSAEGRKRKRWPTTAESQEAEYDALARAAAINRRVAYNSISMGPFQVMGFNHAASGYPSGEAMWQAIHADPAAAFPAWMKFAAKYSSGRCLTALKNRDWETFARLYNGDRTGKYARKMAAAYERFTAQA